MLKQRYASQLTDCSNASIAKTLLIQMPKVSFTKFCNELSHVLGTCQWAASKVSTKAVSVSSAEVESEGQEVLSKSQIKWDKKISAQSPQIKDLHSKLDQAIAKNSQIPEFLNPTSLQMAFTNVLHATKVGPCKLGSANSGSSQGRSKPFLGKCHEPQLWAGKDSNTNPSQSCWYCKDTGHEFGNCARLAARQEFLAHQQQAKEGLNWKLLLLWVMNTGGELQLTHSHYLPQGLSLRMCFKCCPATPCHSKPSSMY